MCSEDYFVTGLGYKFESTAQGISDGTIQGITQIVFQCTKYGSKTTKEEWKYYNVGPFEDKNDNSAWSTFHQSDQINNPMFVCGGLYAGDKFGTTDVVGLHGL